MVQSHDVTMSATTLLVAALLVAIAPCRGGHLRSQQSQGHERRLTTTEAAPASRASGIVSASASARPCGGYSKLEDLLDTLSWEFFSTPRGGPNLTAAFESPQQTKGVRVRVATRLNSSTPSVQGDGAMKALEERLEDWRAAVLRSQQKIRPKSVVLPHSGAAGPIRVRTVVLPPFCASQVPEDDPYWSQKDSYITAEGIVYNECRYSNGCTKQYTNLERVRSIRNTLATTSLLLEKYGVRYSLFGGSALGAFRCKDILPWDIDSDVMVLHGQFDKLFALLEGGQPGTGWKNSGRSIDLAQHGFDGFMLMEKFPGCLPLVVVDKSTGFFTDIFPLHTNFNRAYVPWFRETSSTEPCAASAMFDGCSDRHCHVWSLANTFPPTPCKVNGRDLACPAQLEKWLVEQFGRKAPEHPDIPTRADTSSVL